MLSYIILYHIYIISYIILYYIFIILNYYWFIICFSHLIILRSLTLLRITYIVWHDRTGLTSNKFLIVDREVLEL